MSRRLGLESITRFVKDRERERERESERSERVRVKKIDMMRK